MDLSDCGPGISLRRSPCSRAALLSFNNTCSLSSLPVLSLCGGCYARQCSSCRFYTQAPTQGQNICALLTPMVVSVPAQCRPVGVSFAPHTHFNHDEMLNPPPRWFGVWSSFHHRFWTSKSWLTIGHQSSAALLHDGIFFA